MLMMVPVSRFFIIILKTRKRDSRSLLMRERNESGRWRLAVGEKDCSDLNEITEI